MSKQRRRLDLLLVEQGAFASRQQALGAIMAGLVFVNGERVDKAGTMVPEDAAVEVRGEPSPYVSRGGQKLEKALDTFGWDPEGVVAIDIGASTGGFTDCLLQRGAARVYAVDVGYGQLHWRLRNDPRVVVMERTNARHLNPVDFPEPMDWAVIDVSFISVEKILPAVADLLKPGGRLVCLVKPQFEAGPERVGPKGVVTDGAVHRDVLMDVLRALDDNGFQLEHLTFSPVRGPQGNIEYLAGARRRATGREAAPSGDESAADASFGAKAVARDQWARLVDETVNAAHAASLPTS